MRIICPNCSTEYFLESAKLDLDGTPVQCSSCEHVFTVFPAGAGPVQSGGESSEDVVPPPPPLGADPRVGLFLAQGDRIYKVKDLATLQRWIVEKRVLPGDRVSSDGKSWEVVSARADLRSFFAVIEQIKVAKRAMQRYRREKEEVEARLADVGRPDLQPRRLDAVADGPPIRFAPFPAVPDSAPPPGDPTPPHPAPRDEGPDEDTVRATEETTHPGRRMPEPEAAATDAEGSAPVDEPVAEQPEAEDEEPVTEAPKGAGALSSTVDDTPESEEQTPGGGEQEAPEAAAAAPADDASPEQPQAREDRLEPSEPEQAEAGEEEAAAAPSADASLPSESISEQSAVRESEVETPDAPALGGEPTAPVPPVSGKATELNDAVGGSARDRSTPVTTSGELTDGRKEDGEHDEDHDGRDSEEFFSADEPAVPPLGAPASLDRLPAIRMTPARGPQPDRLDKKRGKGNFSGGSWTRPTESGSLSLGDQPLMDISDQGEVSDPFTPPLEALRAASLARTDPDSRAVEGPQPAPAFKSLPPAEPSITDEFEAAGFKSDDFDPDQTFSGYDRSRSRAPIVIGFLALVAVLIFAIVWMLPGLQERRNAESSEAAASGRTAEPEAPPEASPTPPPDSTDAGLAGDASADAGEGDAGITELPEPTGTDGAATAGGSAGTEAATTTEAAAATPAETEAATPAEAEKPEPTPAATPKPKPTPAPVAAATPTPAPKETAAALAKTGDRARERGDFGGAIRSYRSALELDPSDIGTRVQLGWSYIEQGQNEAAAKTFRAAQARAPGRADAYYGLGLAYQALGRAGEARAQYERYLEIQPDGRDANEVRAMLRSLQ